MVNKWTTVQVDAGEGNRPVEVTVPTDDVLAALLNVTERTARDRVLQRAINGVLDEHAGEEIVADMAADCKLSVDDLDLQITGYRGEEAEGDG